MAGLPNEKIIRYESEDGLHVKAMDMGELVRCKDCKYGNGITCDYTAILVRPNGYCYWGERKDDE